MGGSTESDPAMRWFLERANGGDVLVLRASGSDGYNDYFYSQLGVPINSVETILFHEGAAAADPNIHQKIAQAEAIWFAGGDQAVYVSYWRGTAIDSLINLGIRERSLAVGGTSAGMAIQGQAYFTAERGTIRSEAALINPFNQRITVDTTAFLQNKWLIQTITDTHYDNPDRRGRHLVFMGRMGVDYGWQPKGIACDEYTAVCIEPDGKALVFGGAPAYDGNAYFIQTNCRLSAQMPETMEQGSPLHWYLNGRALKVYAVKGTPLGTNWFDLSDWQTGNGGTWQNWFVQDGELGTTDSPAINCDLLTSNPESNTAQVMVYPNPSTDRVTVKAQGTQIRSVSIFDEKGVLVRHLEGNASSSVQCDLSTLPTGIYHFDIVTVKGQRVQRVLRK